MLLDKLSPPTIAVLSSVGNVNANTAWEATAQDGWVKPTPGEPRESRERYIRAKYQWRGFVSDVGQELVGAEAEGMPEGDAPVPQRDEAAIAAGLGTRLHAAAAAGDTCGVLWCVAHKVEIDWRSLPPEGRTALHHAAAGNHLTVCEVLLQNGANPGALDAQQCSVVDCAMLANAGVAILEYLQEKC